MLSVTPNVYHFETVKDIEYFLKTNGIEWEVPNVTFAEALAELAGRLCYESWNNSDNLNITKIRKGNKEYIGNLKKQKHGSVLEHGGVVFLFYNVSRVFTHELVRHRAGSAFSQTSGRYTRLADLKFWIPDVINDNPAAKSVFLDAIAQDEENQRKLEAIFQEDLAGNFEKKKELTSAFRRISPNGAANNILWSTNHRALRHVIEQRCSEHAEVEIRVVFRKLADYCRQQWPNIYDDLREDYTFEHQKI